MNALASLHFANSDMRMIMRDGEPWWVGDDVARSLDLANPRQALSRLEEYEKGVHIVDTSGGPQSVTIINESGFYSLLLTSRKPMAKAMKRWLITEVLPSIRLHGCYPPPVRAARPLVDKQSPWDGVEKTIGERFSEERERWEAETGYKLADNVPGFSKNVVRAIEGNLGGIYNVKRIEMLLYAEIDVLYVLIGRRTLTKAERTMRDAYRLSDPDQRAEILSSVIALPRAGDLS